MVCVRHHAGRSQHQEYHANDEANAICFQIGNHFKVIHNCIVKTSPHPEREARPRVLKILHSAFRTPHLL
jgi:hypothetical protein